MQPQLALTVNSYCGYYAFLAQDSISTRKLLAAAQMQSPQDVPFTLSPAPAPSALPTSTW